MGVVLSTVVSMSIAASLTALVIMVVRLAMGKVVPRVFFYALWGVVVFQMLSPVSIRSPFSLEQLIPVREVVLSQAVPQEIMEPEMIREDELLPGIQKEAGLNEAGQTEGETVADVSKVGRGVNLVFLASSLWLLGVAIVLGRSLYLSHRLKRRCETAVLFHDKELLAECVDLARLNRPAPVYVTEQAESPFVTGVLRPRVMIPSSLLREERDSIKWVLLHEFSHIRRFDPAVKLLAFLGMAIHWFNPVIWCAFLLMERDMEMSCDERVLSLTGGGTRDTAEECRSYASTLLSMATVGEGYARGSLTFAESNISRRIKNIAFFQKPSKVVKAASGVAAVLLVLLLIPQASAAGDGLSMVSTLLGDSSLPGSILVVGDTGTGLYDTIMVVSQNSDGEIYAAHIPRDTSVGPEYPKISGYAWDHGIEGLRDYLEELWDIRLDHYLVVSYELIEEMVDAAGGIEFDVPMRMRYSDPYDMPPLLIDIPAGLQRLDGETMVKLLRYRSGYQNGDLGRISTQQEIIQAVSGQRTEISNNISLSELVNILRNHELQTDLSLVQLTSALAASLERGVTTLSFDMYPTPEPPYSLELIEESREEVFTVMGL